MILSTLFFALYGSCQSIAETLANPDVGTTAVADLLGSNQLLNSLTGPGLTFFAPSDKAIVDLKALYPEYYQLIIDNTTLVSSLVEYHTLPQEWTRPAEKSNEWFTTKLGLTLGISTPPTAELPVVLTAGLGIRAKIIAQYKCSNGYLYVIDSLLVPPQSLSVTASLLKWAGMLDLITKATLWPAVDNLKDKTFFVPTNEAIVNILAQVSSLGFNLAVSTLSVIIDNHISTGVKYYDELLVNATAKATINSVLPKETIRLGLTAQGVVTVKGLTTASIPAGKIIAANILVTEGVVHIIDSVIAPSNGILLASLTSTVPTIPQ